MQDQAVDKVLDTLRELAGTLGQTAETLWPMAVEATWAKSVSLAAFSAFFILIVPVVFVVAWKLAKRIPKCDLEPEPRWIVMGIVVVLCTIAFVGSVVDLQRALPGLIAPEGTTLFRLLK